MKVKAPFIFLVIIICILALPFSSQANNIWQAELFGGSAFNLMLPLNIEQAGEEDINIQRARFDTNPLDSTPYYSIRLARWQDEKSWEFELLHHTLYLSEKQLEQYDSIDRFTITHGYNLTTINRGWKIDEAIVRVGAGVLIAYPHFTIRGDRYPSDEGMLDTGFHLVGPTAQVSLGNQVDLTENFYLALEGKVTATHGEITFSDGDYRDLKAEVPNIAIHGLIGLGFNF